MSIWSIVPWLFGGRKPVELPKRVSANLVEAINAERVKIHLEPLMPDANLNLLAQGWAEYMARQQTLGHGDFASRLKLFYPNRLSGETIAAWQMTPEQVVASWLSSTAHRMIMLDGRYRIVGVGKAESKTGVIYWCANYVG